MASLYSWLWPSEVKQMKATDAAHHPLVRQHFNQMLDNSEPPDTFTPTEVAKLFKPDELSMVGCKVWQEIIPAIYELAWELREFGDLRIFCKGKELDDDVSFYDIKGPIKMMRREL